ncbi:hypothetical protein P8452_77936 [Trifolium repens]|nr:hypothetical protein P8452_77936 [Trifolium repens]
MGERYIWDDLNIDIVQEPLEQDHDGCAFAATVMQLEYQLRIAYALADPAVQLNRGPILSHALWKEGLQQVFPDIQELWAPWDLLSQSYNKYSGIGCPTVKGLTHWTKKIDNLTNKGQSVEVKAIRDLISRRIPLIAVVHIHRDYLPSAQSIYLGKAPVSSIKLCTHAVVIVGEYEAVEGNAFGLKPGMYYLYQDWFHKNQPRPKSLLPNGISIMHPQLVVAVYYGISNVPTLLAGGAKEAIDQLRTENDHKLHHKRMKHSELNKLKLKSHER